MYLQQSKHCIINQQSKHYNVSWINKQARGKDRLKRSSCNAQGKKWLIVLPVTRQLLGKGGGRGGMWEKKQRRSLVSFFNFPRKLAFLCVIPLKIGQYWQTAGKLYIGSGPKSSPSQFYAEIWFGLLCFEILMKKTGTVLCLLCGLKDFMVTLKSWYVCMYIFIPCNISPIWRWDNTKHFRKSFSIWTSDTPKVRCKAEQLHLKPAKIDW